MQAEANATQEHSAAEIGAARGAATGRKGVGNGESVKGRLNAIEGRPWPGKGNKTKKCNRAGSRQDRAAVRLLKETNQRR